MALSDRDHKDLADAIRLINDVMERHRLTDLTAIEASYFSGAMQDVRIAERYLEASE